MTLFGILQLWHLLWLYLGSHLKEAPQTFFKVVHFGQIRIIQRYCSTFVGEFKHPYSDEANGFIFLLLYSAVHKYTHTHTKAIGMQWSRSLLFLRFQNKAPNAINYGCWLCCMHICRVVTVIRLQVKEW